MNRDRSGQGGTAVIVVIAVIWIILLYAQINKLKYALDQANENIDQANGLIEQANSDISDAKGYAWSSYDEMGSALDNLNDNYDTVDEVPYP